MLRSSVVLRFSAADSTALDPRNTVVGTSGVVHTCNRAVNIQSRVPRGWVGAFMDNDGDGSDDSDDSDDRDGCLLIFERIESRLASRHDAPSDCMNNRYRTCIGT